MAVEDSVWGCLTKHRNSSMLGSTLSLFGSGDPERGGRLIYWVHLVRSRCFYR